MRRFEFFRHCLQDVQRLTKFSMLVQTHEYLNLIPQLPSGVAQQLSSAPNGFPHFVRTEKNPKHAKIYGSESVP